MQCLGLILVLVSILSPVYWCPQHPKTLQVVSDFVTDYFASELRSVIVKFYDSANNFLESTGHLSHCHT